MTLRLFPAIFDRPSKIRFANQEPDEHIEILLRQHFIINVSWILIAILGLLLPLAIPFVTTYLWQVINTQVPPDIEVAALILWYMLIVAYIIEKFLYWYFNIYIVTNLHLVDVDLLNLLNREITEVRLDDVQSARTHIRGIISSLFDFGDLVIETAAEKQRIIFEAIPQPDFVADRIQDLQELQEGDSHDVT